MCRSQIDFLYSARVLAQRETLEAREISLRRALQLASTYENSKSGYEWTIDSY